LEIGGSLAAAQQNPGDQSERWSHKYEQQRNGYAQRRRRFQILVSRAFVIALCIIPFASGHKECEGAEASLSATQSSSLLSSSRSSGISDTGSRMRRNSVLSDAFSRPPPKGKLLSLTTSSVRGSSTSTFSMVTKGKVNTVLPSPFRSNGSASFIRSTSSVLRAAPPGGTSSMSIRNTFLNGGGFGLVAVLPFRSSTTKRVSSTATMSPMLVPAGSSV